VGVSQESETSLLLLLDLLLGSLGSGDSSLLTGSRSGSAVSSPILENSESLVDFFVEGWLVLDEVEKLRVVHLEEHTSDLSGELTLGPGC